MIGPDDIEAFAAMASDDMAQANAFAQRAERGLPSDRWAASEYEMRMVARGIRGLQRLIAIQTALIEGMTAHDPLERL